MKKISAAILLSLFIFSSLCAPAFARRALSAKEKELAVKIEKRIKRLNARERRELLRILRSKKQRLEQNRRYARRKAQLDAELLRVQLEIELLKEYEDKMIAEMVARPVEPPPPKVAPLLTPAARARMVKPRSPQFGLAGGMIGSIPGAMAELRFFEPFDLVATSFRLGLAYAQGEDSDKVMRKHSLVVLDGIYRLNPYWTRGVRSYVGLGLNYNVYTTGQQSGALGYQAFYGVEGNIGFGQMFAEVGYGTIRTGFSPDYSGIGILVGYKF